MKRRVARIGLVAVAMAAASTLALAGGQKLKTEVSGADPEHQSVSLVYYDGSCDGPAECEVASLGCERTGSATVSLNGLAETQLAQWFAAKTRVATLAGGRDKVDIRVWQLTYTEMYGDWQMEGTAGGISDAEWRAFGSATSIRLTFGKTVQNLPVTADFKTFLDLCAKL
jgi:hypothetical protein